MKLWRKVGSGFKSNILILITVALWHKVTQSADALAHLISFMSWRIWISQDTRVKQKVISASFAYLNLVESKLNCQNRDYLPLGILLRVLMTIVWYHGEFTDRIFYWSPTWTKTSEFEQSVEVRTDAKSESGIVQGFPSMNISPGLEPYTVFTAFLVSNHVLLAVITLFLQTLAFYYVNDVKIHTSEQQLKDLGSHFKNRPLDPPCGSKFILIYHFVFATPVRRSFDRCCWDTQRGSYRFYVCIPRCYDKKYKDSNILQILWKKKNTKTKNAGEFCMRGNEDLVQMSLK